MIPNGSYVCQLTLVDDDDIWLEVADGDYTGYFEYACIDGLYHNNAKSNRLYKAFNTAIERSNTMPFVVEGAKIGLVLKSGNISHFRSVDKIKYTPVKECDELSLHKGRVACRDLYYGIWESDASKYKVVRMALSERLGLPDDKASQFHKFDIDLLRDAWQVMSEVRG